MPRVTIQNHTRPLTRPLSVAWRDNFVGKLVGLMGHPPLDEADGILLVESTSSRLNSSIHMLFMKMDISVIWIDEDQRVVDCLLARRWHLAYAPKKAARYILEAHPSRLVDFMVGDQLEFTYA